MLLQILSIRFYIKIKHQQLRNIHFFIIKDKINYFYIQQRKCVDLLSFFLINGKWCCWEGYPLLPWPCSPTRHQYFFAVLLEISWKRWRASISFHSVKLFDRWIKYRITKTTMIAITMLTTCNQIIKGYIWTKEWQPKQR